MCGVSGGVKSSVHVVSYKVCSVKYIYSVYMCCGTFMVLFIESNIIFAVLYPIYFNSDINILCCVIIFLV